MKSKRYLTGRPCRRGHVAERYVSGRQCTECVRENTRGWKETNREKAREQGRKSDCKRRASRSADDLARDRALGRGRMREWRAANIETSRERDNSRRAADPDKARRQGRKSGHTWRTAHPDEAKATKARRRASKLSACPPGTDADAIKDIYLEAAYQGMEVDHFYPLRGKTVCGLHVPANLNLLTKSENSRKGNRIAPSEETWPRPTPPTGLHN